MSYAVVRMQKVKSAGLKGMQFHNQRERKSLTNDDIDEDRSDENYDLANDKNINYNEHVKEIIEEQKISTRKTRKDAVLVNELLVTSDKDFFDKLDPDEQKRFFEESYELFSERYGKQNIAYATVHVDEKTPHMHLGVVPMREGRLQGKNVFNRQELLWLQDKFPKHMQKKGFNLERGEEGSKREHLKTQDYKKQMLEKEIKNKKNELTSEVNKIKSIKTGISNVYNTKLELVNLDNKMKRTMTGKRIVTPEDLNELKKFVEGVEKSAVKSVSKLHQLENKNEKITAALKSTIKERNQVIERRTELFSENKVLEDENRSLKAHLRVADSKLKDLGYDRSKMTEIEFDGHVVIDYLERGIKPKNKKNAENWLNVLNVNKEKELIKGERINNSIDQIKEFIQKFLTKVKDLIR